MSIISSIVVSNLQTPRPGTTNLEVRQALEAAKAESSNGTQPEETNSNADIADSSDK